MGNFWIIGGGKFGLRAARTLRKLDGANRLTIVERRKAVCRRLNQEGFETVCTDGIQYLERNLPGTHFPDWIIPAIPVHVAYEWIRKKLSGTHQEQKVAVPHELADSFPNSVKTEDGQYYTSIADFKCPPNCREPDDICTHTGKPRPMILHEFLKSIQSKGFKSIVLKSHQLAPGVGGYTPAALFDVLNQIRDMPAPVLLSTACSCHGVMNAFQLLAAAESIGRG